MSESTDFIPAEADLFAANYRFVVGVDEAGRGAFAGPLTVGMCSFKPGFFDKPFPESLKGLTDSKKISPARRKKYYGAVKELADFWAILHISSEKIDRNGINPSTLRAILQGCHRARLTGQKSIYLLIDGNYKFPELRDGPEPVEYHSIVKGDSRVFSIAAASILAKVGRDNRMVKFAKYYPGYDLEKHKGYGTKTHREAILEKGTSRLHRRSYLNNLLGEPESSKEEQSTLGI